MYGSRFLRYKLLLLLVFLGIMTFTFVRYSRRSAEIVKLLSSHPSNKSQDYPLLFHQIWLGYTEMPKLWNHTIALRNRLRNPDLEYMLWSAQDIEKLIREDFPWFLNTYKSYSYPIQRVDAARYFILYKYGGFYMDMDIQCRRSFVSIVRDRNLTDYDCILPKTHPVGVSNDLIMCKSGTSFMQYLISRLMDYNYPYILPYLTVMMSTGPSFLSTSLWAYPLPAEIHVLPEKLYTSTYFKHYAGSTWHQWDGYVVMATYRQIGRLPCPAITIICLLFCFICIMLHNRYSDISIYRRIHRAVCHFKQRTNLRKRTYTL